MSDLSVTKWKLNYFSEHIAVGALPQKRMSKNLINYFFSRKKRMQNLCSSEKSSCATDRVVSIITTYNIQVQLVVPPQHKIFRAFLLRQILVLKDFEICKYYRVCYYKIWYLRSHRCCCHPDTICHRCQHGSEIPTSGFLSFWVLKILSI